MFRSSVWDPVLIVSQIVCMQCCFYVSLGFWMFVGNIICGTISTLDQLLDYHEFQGAYDAWLVMVAVSINAFTTALALWCIVRRTKLCLDFAFTIFVIHLVICLCYGGFPLSLAWWLTNLASMGVTAVVGERLCMRSELAAIPIGPVARGGGGGGSTGSPSSAGSGSGKS